MNIDAEAAERFERRYGQSPQVEARAPGRVNLIGDHTDYNDGFVLPAAIPQQTRVFAAIRSGPGPHEAFSETLGERVVLTDEAADAGFARYARAALKVVEEKGASLPPMVFLIASDVPVGAGLSSSASLLVAMLRAIDALIGLAADAVDLALMAHRAETRHVGVLCGVIDQMASSLATPDRMLFLDTRSLRYELRPLPAGAEILVLDSGTRRALASSAYNQRIEECRAAAAALGVTSLRDVDDPAAVERLGEPLRRRARFVFAENARVTRAVRARADEFGRLMKASHAGLRDDFEVVAPAVDALVTALNNRDDVYGARMTGAGFGGACVALVEAGRASEIGGSVVAAARLPGASILVPGQAT